MLNFFSLWVDFKDGWEDRWVKSDWKKDESMAGDWVHTAGKWSGDPADKGMSFPLCC